jgi:hypothetical protein
MGDEGLIGGHDDEKVLMCAVKVSAGDMLEDRGVDRGYIQDME